MTIRTTEVALSHAVPVIEAGLRQILGAWPEFTLRSVPSTPDVLILDHGSAMQRTSVSPREDPSRVQILVVAMDGPDLDVHRALEAGIRGYVLASCSADEIVRATRAVAAGRRHLCTAASSRLADRLGQPSLTQREAEVLSLVLRGQSNKDMARALAISVGTVKSHMRTLFSKLGARCRTEALWIASEHGLLSRPARAAAAPAQMAEPPMTAGALAPGACFPRLEIRAAVQPGSQPPFEERPCPSLPSPVLHPA